MKAILFPSNLKNQLHFKSYWMSENIGDFSVQEYLQLRGLENLLLNLSQPVYLTSKHFQYQKIVLPIFSHTNLSIPNFSLPNFCSEKLM